MKMKKAHKARWLKALRSGKYNRTDGVLYNNKTKGFCCLGVEQHCSLDGKVESEKNNTTEQYLILGLPSLKYAKQQGWQLHGDKNKLRDLDEINDVMADRTISKLVHMNDAWKPGATYDDPYRYKYSFKQIAAVIEREVETY